MAEVNSGGGDPCTVIPVVIHSGSSEGSVDSIGHIRQRLSLMLEVEDFVLTAENSDPELLYETYRTSSEQRSSDGSLSRIYDFDEFLKILEASLTTLKPSDTENGVHPGTSAETSTMTDPHGEEVLAGVAHGTKITAETNMDSISLIDLENIEPSGSSRRESSSSSINLRGRKRSPMTRTSRPDQMVAHEDQPGISQISGKPPIHNNTWLYEESSTSTLGSNEESRETVTKRTGSVSKSPQRLYSAEMVQQFPSTSKLDVNVAASDHETSGESDYDENTSESSETTVESFADSERMYETNRSTVSEMVERIQKMDAEELRAYFTEDKADMRLRQMQSQGARLEMPGSYSDEISTDDELCPSKFRADLAYHPHKQGALPMEDASTGSDNITRDNSVYVKDQSYKEHVSSEKMINPQISFGNSTVEKGRMHYETRRQTSVKEETYDHEVLEPNLLDKVLAAVTGGASVKKQTVKPSYKRNLRSSSSSCADTTAGTSHEAPMAACTSVYVDNYDHTGRRSFKRQMARIYYEPNQESFLVLNRDLVAGAMKKSKRNKGRKVSTTNATVARAEQMMEHERSILEQEEALMVKSGMFDHDDLSSDDEVAEEWERTVSFKKSFISQSKVSSGGLSETYSNNISFGKHSEKYNPDKCPLRRLPSHGSSTRTITTPKANSLSSNNSGSVTYVPLCKENSSTGGRKYKLIPRFLSDLWGNATYSQEATSDPDDVKEEDY